MFFRSAKFYTCLMASVIVFTGMNIDVQASANSSSGKSSSLVSGGAALMLDSGATLESVAASANKSTLPIERQVKCVQLFDDQVALAILKTQPTEENLYSKLVIAQVNNYVNVRSLPSESGEIVGKLYNNSVGTFLAEEDGWYQITSGNVTGYVKAEFCITGEDAVEKALEVGTRIATVNTTTLKVRKEPGLDAEVIGLVPLADELVVLEETEEWVKVDIEEAPGWVSTEYVDLHTEFVQAESKEEEEARLAKEAAEREKARKAAAAAQSKNSASSQKTETATTYVSSEGGSEMGRAVVDYALQFVGNPYVYGGTSLTEGADCSGFVMSVYANFGVSLPHSSAADRKQGSAVEGGLENAQPGDLICYSGHVALYVGDGQIVHASSAKTGIIVSRADYKKILAIRRIF